MIDSGDRSGTQLGPYRLLRLVGRGGMGEVYEAVDTRKDRTVALKLLSARLAADEQFRTRFLRESQTAARLNDPHVIPIHDFGEIDGQLFLDMRIVDGGDLRSLIAGGPVAPATAVDVIGQIAGALDTAHAAGLTHRDVKPENILVDAKGFAYLVDFGLVQSAGQAGLTSTGLAIGSFHYMAPERFGTGAPVGPPSDVYALGCVLYECLTGARPFGAESMEQIVAGQLHRPLPATGTAFDGVIARATAKDPALRYASAGELAEDARAVLAGRPVTRVAPGPAAAPDPTLIAPTDYPPTGYAPAGYAPAGYGYPASPVPPGPAAPQRNRLPLAIAVVSALIVLGGALWFWTGTRAAAPGPVTAGGAGTATVTVVPGETVTETATAAPPPTTTGTAARAVPAPGSGDLGLSIPISSPPCDGRTVAVVYNATNPGAYAQEIAAALQQYPGSSYLRTDQSCGSLKQSENGNPIYAVYYPGASLAETCGIKARIGGNTYARRLDDFTPVGTEVC